MGKLAGRTAIITGAASGIGRAAAKLFSAAGAYVVIADLSDKVNETLAQVTAAGGKGEAIVGDVATGEVVDQLIAAAEKHGGVDVMFANAGVSGGLPGLMELTAEHWNNVLRIIAHHQFRNALARRAKKARPTVERSRKKRRPPRKKRLKRSTVRST